MSIDPGCELNLCPDNDKVLETMASRVALSTDNIRQATENFTGSIICTSAKVECDGALDIPLIADGGTTTLKLCGAKITEVSLNIELTK